MAAIWKSLLTFSLAGMIAFATDQEPFAGTWRFRADRSKHLRTFKIYPVGEGAFQVDTSAGRGAVLPLDGSESPQVGMVALKKIDPLSAIPLTAQNPPSKLDNDLLALHAAWFKAFDSANGAVMDEIETGNLTLLMPDGTVFHKTEPRAGKQGKADSRIKHSLSEASIRQFGSAAILTGILTTELPEKHFREATMVVFVQQDGKWKIASASWTSVDDPKEKR